jgi:hypothetical protein
MADPKAAQSTEAVLLDMRGAAKFLGLTYWKVYGLLKGRQIPVVELNGKFYFRRATLLRFVERSEGKYRAA